MNYKKEILKSLDVAKADIASRINCGAKVRCMQHLQAATNAIEENDYEKFRYYFMCAQGCSQVIPPKKHAGIIDPMATI